MNTIPPTRLGIETDFYNTHKTEWLQNHRDKFVVIKGKELLGFFPNFHEGYSAGVKRYGADSDFLVKRIAPQEPLFEVF